MKKLLTTLGLYLGLTFGAHANVPCSVPFNLMNGQTADASQVMANYNAILSCLANSAAKSGVNSDITALLALATPIPPAVGGSVWFIGGTASGTNAQVVSSTTPSTFSLTIGYCVSFIAGGANTGATTLNVNGTGATNFYHQTAGGVVAMTGGEISIGQLILACYDGAQFQLESPTSSASLTMDNQVLSGGAIVTAYNNGTPAGSGTLTVNCGLGPLQYFTDNAAFTLAAPANDGSCMLLGTNGASAGTITFSGFTVGSNTGDALTTTNGNKFTISVWRINGTASYFVKALQ